MRFPGIILHGMKNNSTLVLFLFFVFFSNHLSAQPLFQKGIAILIENDLIYLLQPSDKYYTSGLEIGMYIPELAEKKVIGWPYRALFFKNKKGWASTYGFHLNQNIYTPAKITDQSLRVNDHPYASTLLLKLDKIDVNPVYKVEIQQTWQLGVLGPSAGGALVQKSYHTLVNRPIPQGWNYQIQNLPAIGYEMQLKKALWTPNSRNINLAGKLGANIGTINNFLEAGAQVRFGNGVRVLGHWTQPLTKGIRLESSFHIRGRWVIQNTILEGPWWNRNEIPQQLQLEHLIAICGATLMIQFRRWALDLQQTIVSPQFKGGLQHHWGSIRMVWQM
jgi:lipid A 3-O-deacylase